MEKIAFLAASIYKGKDWRTLTQEERELVATLEQMGYLSRNEPPNGFVGKVQLPLKFNELEIIQS